MITSNNKKRLLVLYICTLYILTTTLVLGKLHQDDNTYHLWQITDPHIDDSYVEGAVANCDTIICCRANSKPKDPSSPVITAGKFGVTLADCDIPFLTFQSALDFVNSYYPVEYKRENELFVFYGGDNTAHDDWNYSKGRIVDVMTRVHKALINTFRSASSDYKSLVLSAIGNHDTYPIDQFDFPPGSNWYLNPFAELMSNSGIDKAALDSLTNHGYYTMLVKPGIRAIILNTQYEDQLNFYLFKSTEPDPGHHLAFIEATLQSAVVNNEKVVILGHIPIGLSAGAHPECTLAFSAGYAQLVEKYSSVIVFTTFGHTHTDSFKIITDSATQSKPQGVAFITPSVTTWTAQNPSVRLFKLDKKTFELVDVITFTANVTQANIEGQLTFKQEYSAKETYGMPDLSPTSWYNLAHQLLTNDTLWGQFNSLFHNKLRLACPTNNKRCRLNHFCGAVSPNPQAYADCTLN